MRACRNNPAGRKALIGVLLGALLVVGLAFQGQRGIFETTESRYSGVASEMLRLGDWIVPHLNEEQPHLTKPPLTYWLLAAGIDVFGRNELAVRLPGAIAFILTVLTLARSGQTLTPRKPLLPAVIYATFLFPATVSNIVCTDNLLALFEVAAMAGFAEHYFGTRRHAVPPAVVGWACFGLAFLTKGYPALLPMAALAVFHGWRGRQLPNKRLFHPAGVLAFAGLGTGWFFMVIARDPSLLQYFIVDELVGRVTGQHDRNPEWYKAFTVYGPVLLLGSIPWTVSATRAVGESFRFLFRKSPEGDSRLAGTQDIVLYLVLWLTIPTLVFLLIQSRLPLYVLPQFAPLALLSALWLSAKPFPLHAVRAKVCASVAIVLALRIVAAEMYSDDDSRIVADQVAALHGDSPQEIVFVESAPYRGLSFYLGAEVEQVALSKESAGPSDIETLADELDAPESGRIWLVPASLAEQFRALASSLGFAQVTMLGAVAAETEHLAFSVAPGPLGGGDLGDVCSENACGAKLAGTATP